MLEKFVIFGHSGLVYYSAEWNEIRGDPIGTLVRDVILPQRPGNSLEAAEYTLKWTVSHSADVICCAVIDKSLAAVVKYVEALLDIVRKVFEERHKKQLSDLMQVGPSAPLTGLGDKTVKTDMFGFAPLFDRCLREAEGTKSEPAGRAGTKAGRAAASVSEGDNVPARTDSSGKEEPVGVEPGDVATDGSGGEEEEGGSGDDESGGDARAPGCGSGAGLRGGRRGRGGRHRPTASASKKAPVLKSTSSASSKSFKGLTALPLTDFKYTAEAAKTLERSVATSGAEAVVERVVFKHDASAGGDLDDSDEELFSKVKSAPSAASAGAGGGGLSSWFAKSKVGSFLATLTGNKVLERSDLEGVEEALKSLLIGKNVAKEIADQLCESVSESLIGHRLEMAGSAAAVMEGAIRESINRIMTPRRVIDMLAEVRAKKESGKGPYVIVFVGVNGVGKSTSLSKVAYLLKDQHHSVMIAACDSFRAGAVEQLKRHCTALDIPLYQQGYGKDPVVIASGAIKEAFLRGTDVVLVDTAGRMQNNAPLMTQIAKVVAVNSPDLVLFVGEALVGNDGVDQLAEFDRSLVDYAVDKSNPRRIDGILLTKFDTIDDKVGASLSMVYKTGIPVVFVGTGQKYTDLRRLNVGAVVKALMA